MIKTKFVCRSLIRQKIRSYMIDRFVACYNRNQSALNKEKPQRNATIPNLSRDQQNQHGMLKCNDGINNRCQNSKFTGKLIKSEHKT